MNTDENLVEVYRCSSELEFGRAVAEVLEPEGIDGYRRDRASHSLPAPDSETGGLFIAVPEADAARARQLLREALSDGALDAQDGRVVEEAVACYRRAVDLQPDYIEAHTNLVFTLHFCPNQDAAALFAECRRWNRSRSAKRPAAPRRKDRIC